MITRAKLAALEKVMATIPKREISFVCLGVGDRQDEFHAQFADEQSPHRFDSENELLRFLEPHGPAKTKGYSGGFCPCDWDRPDA